MRVCIFAVLLFVCPVTPCGEGIYEGYMIHDDSSCSKWRPGPDCYETIFLRRSRDCDVVFFFNDAQCGTGKFQHNVSMFYSEPTAPAHDVAGIYNDSRLLLIESEDDIVTIYRLPGCFSVAWQVVGWNTNNLGVENDDEPYTIYKFDEINKANIEFSNISSIILSTMYDLFARFWLLLKCFSQHVNDYKLGKSEWHDFPSCDDVVQ